MVLLFVYIVLFTIIQNHVICTDKQTTDELLLESLLLKQCCRCQKSLPFVAISRSILFPDVKPKKETHEFSIAAGVLRVIYNQRNITATSTLNISIETLASIYSGEVKFWNDSHIQIENPQLDLPNERILPIAYNHLKQNNLIFIHAMNRMVPNWKSDDFSKSIWFRANSEKDVANMVTQVPYTIGFLSYTDSISRDVNYVDIRTKHGQSITAKYILKSTKMSVIKKIYNSYPFSYYLTVSFHQNDIEKDCFASKAVLNGLLSLLNDEISLEKSGMIALDEYDRREIENDVLKNMKCNGKFMLKDSLVTTTVITEKTTDYDFEVGISELLNLLLLALLLYCIYSGYNLRKESRQKLMEEWLHDVQTPFAPADDQDEDSKTEKNSGIMKAEGADIDYQWANMFATVTFLPSDQWPFYKGLCSVYHGRNVLLFWSSVKHDPATFLPHTSVLLRKLVRNVRHRNLQEFFGLTIINEDMMMSLSHQGLYHIYDGCCKSNLHMLLQTSALKFTFSIMYSLALDIISGLIYLHDEDIVHGILNSWNCVIDQNWVVKITNWTQSSLCFTENRGHPFHNPEIKLEKVTNSHLAKRLLYQHPDILRGKVNMSDLNEHHDFYSLAMLLIEIFTRKPPFQDLISNEDGWGSILSEVVNKGKEPKLPILMPIDVRNIIKEFRKPTPETSLDKAAQTLREAGKFTDDGLVDKLLQEHDLNSNDESKIAASKRFTSAAGSASLSKFKGFAKKTIINNRSLNWQSRWAAPRGSTVFGGIYTG